MPAGPNSSSLADRPDFDQLVLGALKCLRGYPPNPVDIAQSMRSLPEAAGRGPSWQAVYRALRRLDRDGLARRDGKGWRSSDD